MQQLLLDCIDGVYIARYGHLVLVLTQDIAEAERVGSKYMHCHVYPRWWNETVLITNETAAVIYNTVHQIHKALGHMGVNEFCGISGESFYLSGFSI